tara:strand:- start:1384 stop:2325 length:942 start_codon:yes stop_codon:yes gene_type:complete
MKSYVVLGHCDHDGWTHSDTDVYGVFTDRDKANAWVRLAYEEEEKLHSDDDIYDRMCYWIRESEIIHEESATIIPLGYHCVAAESLSNYRKEAFPFDYVVSSPEYIEKVLQLPSFIEQVTGEKWEVHAEEAIESFLENYFNENNFSKTKVKSEDGSVFPHACKPELDDWEWDESVAFPKYIRRIKRLHDYIDTKKFIIFVTVTHSGKAYVSDGKMWSVDYEQREAHRKFKKIILDRRKGKKTIFLRYAEGQLKDHKGLVKNDLDKIISKWDMDSTNPLSERYLLPPMPPVVYKEKIIGQDICGNHITEIENNE